jgi:DNA-3-methyladenine glycosylase II
MTEKKAIRHLKKDPNFAKIIPQVGEYNVKITKNRYRALIEAIIAQQLSGSAAESILKKFRNLYESNFPKPIEVLQTSDNKLRKVGLSKMKVIYIKELSKKIEFRHLNMKNFSSMENKQIIEHLTNLKGIGRWTAEMFLIFSMGRWDVLPVGDLGLKKGIQLMFSLNELPSEEQIREYAESWRPYRTVATWYIWKSLKKFNTIG